MRKFIYPGQSIGLPLTVEEREHLVEGCLVIDNTYLAGIKEAPTDRPEVPFTLDELDDFCGFVAFEANHAKGRKKQKALDAICGKIQHLLETHTDEDALAGKVGERDERGEADNGMIGNIGTTALFI